MKAKRASPLLPIRRSTESAVPSRSSAKSTKRSMLRLAGSMVVSFSCAGIISPKPLLPGGSGGVTPIKLQDERSGRLFCTVLRSMIMP